MRVRTAKYTQAEYLQLPEGFPAQLVEGELVKEPSPSYWHQEVVFRLGRMLHAAAAPRPVVLAPADVFLDEHNVLQPDVMVLPEGARIRPGEPPPALPVLVAEVLSPWTADRDRHVKAAVYLRAGVREVWLVDPERKTIEFLPHGASRILPGAIDPDELFRE